MKKTLAIGLLLMVVGSLGTLMLGSRPVHHSETTEAQHAPAIQIRRLQPLGDDEVVRVPSPGGPVEFLYELSNEATTTLSGLQVHLFCQCAVTQPLPETIEPGQKVQFGFRFPPPPAGIRSEQVTITAGQTSEPIVAMKAHVYADVPVPHLILAPEIIQISAIRGESICHDMLISIIERVDSEHLIQKPNVDPPGVVTPAILDVRETAEYDRANVRRVYHLQLQADAADVIRDTDGSLQLCERIGTRFLPIPVRVQVLEPVTLIPKSFDFRPTEVASGKSQTVNIVRRGNSAPGAVRIKECDRELIDVRCDSQENNQVRRFTVTPKSSSQRWRETTIVFEVQEVSGLKNDLNFLVRLVPE